MADGGYHNLPAKPTDQTTASIGGATGRDVTSPADDLRALLANEDEQEHEWNGMTFSYDACVLDWFSENASAVLALLDAAQATVDNANLVCDEEILLDRALRALTEPRP